MPLRSRIASLWRNIAHRSRVDEQLDEELSAYVDLVAAEHARAGMTASQARRTALLQLGGVEGVKMQVREARTGAWLEAFAHDVQYGARGLKKTPGFTLAATLTLALGIGATTSMFSLMNAVLLRPLPFHDPDRLVRVYEQRANDGNRGEVSGHEFVAWRERNHTLAGLALFSWREFNLTGSGEPQAVTAMEVSANFFTVEGITPLLGRAFAMGEDATGADRVAVLTSSLWRKRYGADSAIIGRSILLDGARVTVVGVMPPLEGFESDLWVPMDLPAEVQRVGKHSNYVVGRLKPGVSLAAAQSDLSAAAIFVAEQFPNDNAGHGVAITSQYDDTVQNVRRPVLVAFGAVAFVLLIACVNVAHLMLKRAAVRQKEVAIRMALGASRRRVVAQLLAEGVLLSVLGGAFGVMLAVWASHVLPTLQAVRIPRLATVAIDSRVLAVTCLLSIFTGMISGVAPALQATRPKLRQWMGEGRGTTGGVSSRLTGAFVISEVALALVLLIGAGLLIQSFARLLRVNPGFNPDRVLAVSLALPPSRYPTPQQSARAFTQLSARLAALPGVKSVGAASSVPLSGCCNNIPVSIEGRPPAPRGESETAVWNTVTPGYFHTMGIRLVQGRDFSESDARIALPLVRYWPEAPYPARFNDPQPQPVAVISETMARQYWPGTNPIGKRFRILFSPWLTVAGIVSDVRHAALGGPPTPDMYLPHSQEPDVSMVMVIRTAGPPMELAASVRREIHAFDRDLPVDQMASMEQVIGKSVGRSRFNALLIGVFGAVALLLSLVGTYGVIAYGVAQRTHEIGIRAALGASATDVLSMILGRALRLTLAGVAIGVAGALALTRLLEGLLFGVTPTDPVTFIAISGLLAVVSLAASYLPTRRAMRVDPLIAMRAD
jgi:putative ABC transport system permease protein